MVKERNRTCGASLTPATAAAGDARLTFFGFFFVCPFLFYAATGSSMIGHNLRGPSGQPTIIAAPTRPNLSLLYVPRACT